MPISFDFWWFKNTRDNGKANLNNSYISGRQGNRLPRDLLFEGKMNIKFFKKIVIVRHDEHITYLINVFHFIV